LQKSKDNSLPKSIITAKSVLPQLTNKQPSVITIAQMKTMITEAQKEPTTSQLVRTESGPLQAAIDALQGPSPTKKKKRRGTKETPRPDSRST